MTSTITALQLIY